MEIKFCQSCMMPLVDEKTHGTNKDGTYNEDYCHHCFQNGEFTTEITMEEMINTSLKYSSDNHYGSKEQALESLNKIFPTLKRWNKIT